LIAVDTSAVVAIMRREPEQVLFTGIMREARELSISAASVAETLIVLAGRSGGDNAPEVLEFLAGVDARIVSVSHAHALLANQAFLAYGKGRHKAALNYGDCFSYALAKSLDAQLLFKGDDFRHTDVRAVV
jgi:ribonuclease VapC